MINLQPAATWQLIAWTGVAGSEAGTRHPIHPSIQRSWMLEQELKPTRTYQRASICINGNCSWLIQLNQIWLGARHLSKEHIAYTRRQICGAVVCGFYCLPLYNPPRWQRLMRWAERVFKVLSWTSSATTLTPCLWRWCVHDDPRLGIEKLHIFLIRKKRVKRRQRIIAISRQISWGKDDKWGVRTGVRNRWLNGSTKESFNN